jgi:hypothetical protein
MLAWLAVKRLRQKKEANPIPEQVEGPFDTSVALENKDASHHVAQPEVITVTSRAEQSDPVTSTARQNVGSQLSREEKKAARRYRIRLIIGLFFPFALQALDVTIIASALPWIASDFRT